MPHPRLLAGCTLLQLAATLVAADPVARAELPEPARPEAAAAWRALPVAQRSAVVIDGDLAEWSESGAIDLPFDPGQQRVREWGGLADCSARLRLGWSEEALLIAVLVRDDRHEPLSGEHLWQGDSIQFATGLDGLGPEFGVAAGPEGVRTYRWNHGPSEDGQITAAAKRGEGVTTYEVAVPWTAVAGGRRPAGRLLGFSLVVNDNDGSGRKGYIELTAGIGETKDHRRYALLAFAGADKPSLAFSAPGRVAVDQGGSISLDG